MIKGLNPMLPESGKIKIGGHGELKKGKNGDYRLPVKYDHFIITTLEKDDKDNFVEDVELTSTLALKKCEHGKPTSVGPCMFLFNGITENFYTAYRYYLKSKLVCRGDGENGIRYAEDGTAEEVKCDPETCPFVKNKLCKPNGILSVFFPQSKVLGGVHRLRTTSYNTISNLLSQMHMFNVLTGGHIAGVKFNLNLLTKDAVVNGKKQTIYHVALEYYGGVDSLIQASKDNPIVTIGQDTAKRMLIESDKLLEEPEEFYPEHEIDGNGNVISEGKVVDTVKQPEGKGAFAEKKQPERKKVSQKHITDITTPLKAGYEEVMDEQSPSVKTMVNRVNESCESEWDLTEAECKVFDGMLQDEYVAAKKRQPAKQAEPVSDKKEVPSKKAFNLF